MPKFKEETIQWSEDKKDKNGQKIKKTNNGQKIKKTIQWSEDKKDNTIVRR